VGHKTVDLHSVDIEDSGQLKVAYSKNFQGCADLVDSDKRKTHSGPRHFCGQGAQIEETFDLYDFSFVRNEVQLCRGGGSRPCSKRTPIRAPEHRLVFYLHCDLVGDLANRLDLPFDCSAPSEELMNEVGRRLSLYARDLQTVFAKRTVRRFAFDPAVDVVLTEESPHTGSCCHNPKPKPFSHELWIWAQLTDLPSNGTYGGTMSYDSSGAGVAARLYWDQIHDPARLEDHSLQLEQYWRQLDHIIHEFEHAFHAGLGEYYNLAVVGDSTGVEPIIEIRKGGDNPYWTRNADYFADPLLHNIWNNSLADSPTAYADLLATVDFAPVTAAVLNCAARFNLAKTVHDLSKARVLVVSDESGEPITGALVYVWNTRTSPPYASEAQLADAQTGPDGMIDSPWSCCEGVAACASCFTNDAKLIKVFAEGHHPAVRLFSVFDAQKSKLVDRQPELVIEIRMVPVRDEGPGPTSMVTAMAD